MTTYSRLRQALILKMVSVSDVIDNRIIKCSTCHFMDKERLQCSKMCGLIDKIANKGALCPEKMWNK